MVSISRCPELGLTRLILRRGEREELSLQYFALLEAMDNVKDTAPSDTYAQLAKLSEFIHLISQ